MRYSDKFPYVQPILRLSSMYMSLFSLFLIKMLSDFRKVSSFNTRGRHLCYNNDDDFEALTCDEKDDARWKNCFRRDFTINGFV